MAIHPTAIIDSKATLGDGCDIGPYCSIGPDVSLGAGCNLHSHVVIDGHTSLGDECEVFPFACLGKKTQDLKYKGEETYVRIGSRTVIREYVTINAATGGGDATAIGDDCLIQSYCHIAHDCTLGNKVIMSSAAMLSGHIEVGDAAVIGGHSGVVQFVKIGTMSMVGGFSKLGQDVCAFCIADGVPAETRVTNKVGMQRNGKSPEQIQAVMNAFRVIFQSDLSIDDAVAALRDSAAEFTEVQTMLDFIAASERGLARPKKK
ncbi:MAG: acyl-ACP--UDP-N-acetylglucosamine O-acyltransferase [Lentisphaeria bacterium]